VLLAIGPPPFSRRPPRRRDDDAGAAWRQAKTTLAVLR
jgi:hypothetical protein